MHHLSYEQKMELYDHEKIFGLYTENTIGYHLLFLYMVLLIYFSR